MSLWCEELQGLHVGVRQSHSPFPVSSGANYEMQASQAFKQALSFGLAIWQTFYSISGRYSQIR